MTTYDANGKMVTRGSAVEMEYVFKNRTAENKVVMVSSCCGARIMDVYNQHGRCIACKEMASAEIENSCEIEA